jgi:hypothetical protein
MGFRTVVVLNNDLANEWENDPELGKKIFHAASAKQWGGKNDQAYFQYGDTIEQVHADTQTVAFLDGYGGKAVAHYHWYCGQTEEQKNLQMLKALADKLGYRVSKKPVKG